jgi:hypothetical protein
LYWPKSPVIKIIKIVIFFLHPLSSHRKRLHFLSSGFSLACLTEKKLQKKTKPLFREKIEQGLRVGVVVILANSKNPYIKSTEG